MIDVTYDWNRNKNEFSPFDRIDAFLNSYRILNEPVCASNIQDVPNINLSSEQNEILNICKNYAKSVMNNMNNTHPESTTIKRIIIQGKAGTCKSTLIQHIVKEVSSMLGSDSIAVTANTGAAALNFNGNTLHSFSKIPILSQILIH